MSKNRIALIVDDDRNAQSTISSIFWKLGWARPKLVTSAKDGLAILADDSTCFDVIVLDQNLPVMTGLDFLAEAKKINRELPPVIMLTGNSESAVESRAKELGVAAFLMKDQLSKLKEVLDELIDKGRSK